MDRIEKLEQQKKILIEKIEQYRSSPLDWSDNDRASLDKIENELRRLYLAKINGDN